MRRLAEHKNWVHAGLGAEQPKTRSDQSHAKVNPVPARCQPGALDAWRTLSVTGCGAEQLAAAAWLTRCLVLPQRKALARGPQQVMEADLQRVAELAIAREIRVAVLVSPDLSARPLADHRRLTRACLVAVHRASRRPARVHNY